MCCCSHSDGPHNQDRYVKEKAYKKIYIIINKVFKKTPHIQLHVNLSVMTQTGVSATSDDSNPKASSSSLHMEVLKTKQQDKMICEKVIYKNSFSDSLNEELRE